MFHRISMKSIRYNTFNVKHLHACRCFLNVVLCTRLKIFGSRHIDDSCIFKKSTINLMKTEQAFCVSQNFDEEYIIWHAYLLVASRRRFRGCSLYSVKNIWKQTYVRFVHFLRSRSNNMVAVSGSQRSRYLIVILCFQHNL